MNERLDDAEAAKAMSKGGHPAKFSKEVMEVIVAVVREEVQHKIVPGVKDGFFILDPFAGVGGIHDLHFPDLMNDDGYVVFTVGVELEPEWAIIAQAKGITVCYDFFDFDLKVLWNFGIGYRHVDCIVTSPAYGNRMADSHEAKDLSRRVTYTHRLGRKLSPNNSGAMQWGDEYREFHINAWTKVWSLLADGGLFVLNVSDHIRGGVKQPVVAWHESVCRKTGFTVTDSYVVKTRRMKMGENAEARVDGERVLVMRKVTQ